MEWIKAHRSGIAGIVVAAFIVALATMSVFGGFSGNSTPASASQGAKVTMTLGTALTVNKVPTACAKKSAHTIAYAQTRTGLVPVPGKGQPQCSLSFWTFVRKHVRGEHIAMRVGSNSYFQLVKAGTQTDVPLPYLERNYRSVRWQPVEVDGRRLVRCLVFGTPSNEFVGLPGSGGGAIATTSCDFGVRFYAGLHATYVWVGENGLVTWYRATGINQHKVESPRRIPFLNPAA